MEALKSYLIDEFKDRAKGYAAVDFKFTHSVTMRTDKSTKTPLKVDVVKVALRFVDKDMNTLHSSIVVFENNAIPKSKEKQLINISPKELSNKFCFAKHDIVRSIMNEYMTKRGELSKKIDELNSYSGNAHDIIDSKFKGEVVNVTNEEPIDKPTKKAKFDM